MSVNHPGLTRSQRLVLSLLNSDWMTGPDLARAVDCYLRSIGAGPNSSAAQARGVTPQGVHQTIASLVRRGYVEKYRIHGVVRFRVVPDANRARPLSLHSLGPNSARSGE